MRDKFKFEIIRIDIKFTFKGTIKREIRNPEILETFIVLV